MADTSKYGTIATSFPTGGGTRFDKDIVTANDAVLRNMQKQWSNLSANPKWQNLTGHDFPKFVTAIQLILRFWRSYFGNNVTTQGRFKRRDMKEPNSSIDEITEVYSRKLDLPISSIAFLGGRNKLPGLRGNEYYCFLDGFFGYFQFPIRPQRDQRKRLTFTCLSERLPTAHACGLSNAPGHVFPNDVMLAIFHEWWRRRWKSLMDDLGLWDFFPKLPLPSLDHMFKGVKTPIKFNWERAILWSRGHCPRHKISKKGIGLDKAKSMSLQITLIPDHRSKDI
ncbi:hypothetical protein Tco_0786553 [Tanacetum coccineum]